MSGLNRASDVIVAQESKQARFNNPCKNKCGAGALCLLNSSSSRTCTCSALMVQTVSESGVVTCQNPDPGTRCNLFCNSGKCVVDSKGSPTCKCPALYEGERCEKYRCSGYCRNKGICYPNNSGQFQHGTIHFVSTTTTNCCPTFKQVRMSLG